MTELATDNGARVAPLRIQVNMSEFSLADLGAIDKECWDRHGCTLEVAFQDWRQKPAMAIVAWYARRRVDPSFTVEDAMALPPSALEIVDNPEPSSNGTTTAPPPLLESGA